MHSLATFVVLATCASATFLEHSGRFSLTLERRAPSARSLARRGDGKGSAEVEAISFGTDWVTSMKVGGQVVRAQIDTGSGDLWFISSLADDATKQQYSNHTFFDPEKSSTWNLQQNLVFNSTYDVGELGAIGIVGTETVELGGVTVTAMAIGAATSIFGEGVLEPEYDGVMGLGFGSLQSSIVDQSGQMIGAPTFMQAVQNSLSQPVFTLDFRPNVPETINFGFINEKIYTGQLAKLPIDNTTSFWTVNGVRFSSGDTNFGKSSGAGVPVIFDSGGLGTTVDNSTAAAYWALVEGSARDEGVYTFPCNTPTLPELVFHFPSGASASINGTILNQTALSTDGITCSGGVQVSSNGVFNAGNGFFGSYFTVFNQADPSMSFAPYVQNFQDTDTTNEAGLPTATDASGVAGPTPTSSSSASASPSPGSNAAVGKGVGSSLALLVAAFTACML